MVAHTDSADLPSCCGTGCTVCVLDYPELFSNSQACNQPTDNQADSDMLKMLEAIEQAQLWVDQTTTENSKLQ